MPLPREILEGLGRLDLLPPGAAVAVDRLTGGVSSEIWKVTAGDRVFCVKRALAKLAVKDDWYAPVERNRYERLWYATANAKVPGVAPRVLGFDDRAMFFAMEWLAPARYRLWKRTLPPAASTSNSRRRSGRSSLQSMPRRRGTKPSRRRSRPEAFRGPAPRALSPRHRSPASRPRASLERRADTTAETRRSLVHGDVSPKKFGRTAGPVFLDAECAWYGDPAFDVAFCLNHLLLKCLLVPAHASRLLAAFDRLWASPTWRHQLGAPARPSRRAPPPCSRPFARAGRRQVAGRVCDDRSRRGARPQGGAGP